MALSSQRKSRNKRESSAGQETREERATKDAASRLRSAPRKPSETSERTGGVLGAGAPHPVPCQPRQGRVHEDPGAVRPGPALPPERLAAWPGPHPSAWGTRRSDPPVPGVRLSASSAPSSTATVRLPSALTADNDEARDGGSTRAHAEPLRNSSFFPFNLINLCCIVTPSQQEPLFHQDGLYSASPAPAPPCLSPRESS